MVVRKVKTINGTTVLIPESFIEHVVRKHSEILSMLNLSREEFLDLVQEILRLPSEVYLDALNVKYFLRKINDLYLNVIVKEKIVRTSYLISQKTYERLGRKKWLQRLF